MKKILIFISFLFFYGNGFGQRKTLNDVYFQGLDFSEIANFGRTDFNIGAHFHSAHFKKFAQFSYAKFPISDFALSSFDGSSAFDFASFTDTANFSGATYSKYCSFNKATFKAEAFFELSHFNDVTFSNAKFKKSVDFSGAQFSTKANFRFAQFLSKIYFLSARFAPKMTLDLSNLTLTDSSKFDFTNTVLPDTILLGNDNDLKNEVNLIDANFTDSSRYEYAQKAIRPIWLYVFNSNVAKLHLDYLHFRLLIPDYTIGQVNSIYHKRLISYDDKTALYEALLNNFKLTGQTESFRLLDIEYQTFKWNHSWAHFFGWLPKLWWNFGYDKEYIFAWTFCFLMLFSCFTYFFIHSLNTRIYPIEKIPTNGAWVKKLSLRDFIKRFWFSLMYTSTVFFKLSVDVKNLEFKERRGTFYIIVVYTLGIVCLAYMANFVLQK